MGDVSSISYYSIGSKQNLEFSAYVGAEVSGDYIVVIIDLRTLCPL